MSAIKKLASQTAVYGLSSIIGRLAVWGLTPIYTAKLLPGEYGVFSDLYSFVTYFLVMLTFGMETSFFRYSSDDKLDKRPYTQSLMFVGGLALLFLLIFGLGHQSFADLLGYSDRPGLILMVVFIIFFDVIVSLPMAKLRYDERPMVFAAISLISIFLNIGLNLWFILVQKKTAAEYVFISNLIASGFKFSLLIFFSLPFAERLKQLGRVGAKLGSINVLPDTLKVDKKMMRSMIGFGFYIMLAGLFGMINQYSDVNFIKRIWGDLPTLYGEEYYTGAELAGIFGANKKLAVFILLVTQAFRYAAEPFFFRHAKESNSKAVFAKVFHYFMLAALGVFLLVSSFSYELVNFSISGYTLIDARYHVGLEVVPTLLFAFVLWGAYINISIWFKLTKQVRFGILFAGIGVVTIVSLDFILIPFFGYMGAAVAMLTCYSVMCALVYMFGQAYYPIPYRIKRTAVYMVIFLLAFFICNSIDSTGLFSSGFFYKFLICLVAFAAVWGIEKFIPINWSAGGGD